MLIVLAIAIGFVLLVWSADIFVKGAAAIAQNLGVSPALVGLTIVSIGTSSPEILVSISAAFAGAGKLAIGNAIGSNIANIGLVLGCTLCICSISVAQTYVRLEIPILLAVTTLVGLLILDRELSRTDAVLMMASLITSLYLIVRKRLSYIASTLKNPPDETCSMNNYKAILIFLFGLIILIFSSRLLVWGATNAAAALGVSELVIGLTVVAVGTSLPELAASIVSALKRHADLAFGNIIGSNIFNLLAVMPVPALIQSMNLSNEFLHRDFFTMVLLILLLAVFVLIANTKNSKSNNGAKLGRGVGAVFVMAYSLYYYWLYNSL